MANCRFPFALMPVSVGCDGELSVSLPVLKDSSLFVACCCQRNLTTATPSLFRSGRDRFRDDCVLADTSFILNDGGVKPLPGVAASAGSSSGTAPAPASGLLMDSGVLAVVVAASSPTEWHGKAVLFDAPEGLQRGDFDGVVDAYLQAKVRS